MLEIALKAEERVCLLFITGTNKPPDRTLTVVAIVIPVILSICVILSCYCFRRYVFDREKLTYVDQTQKDLHLLYLLHHVL